MQEVIEKTNRRSETRRVPKHSTEAPRCREPPIIIDIYTLVVQAERREIISKSQDEEEKWATLTIFLRGEFDKLTHWKVSFAWKLANCFVLSEDGILYYLGRSREVRDVMDEDLKLRLIFPTTLIDEILLNCHNSVNGGHQGIVKTFHRMKSDFY